MSKTPEMEAVAVPIGTSAARLISSGGAAAAVASSGAAAVQLATEASQWGRVVAALVLVAGAVAIGAASAVPAASVPADRSDGWNRRLISVFGMLAVVVLLHLAVPATWDVPILGLLIAEAGLAIAGIAVAAARPRPARTVVFVGDRSAGDWVATAASGCGREIIAELAPADGAHAPLCDEVVVTTDAFAAYREAGGASSLDRGRFLLLDVAPGQDVSVARDPFVAAVSRTGAVAKRAIDLIASCLALIVLAPVLAFLAIAVRLDSTGPALFVQERVGLDGRRFRVFKFRTMRVNNDDSAHRAYVAALIRGEGETHDGLFKLTNDDRVTPMGRVLRRYSLDELPQLFNVVRGEMSLVGPRPPLPAEVDLYDARAWSRLRVKPGVTGLWQVSGRSELTFQEMVDLDVQYCEAWNLALDLQILLRTPRVVLGARGAA